jgi:iron complex outermembrane receptor protein
VVVTANRREETIQKSSLAVQAISGDEVLSAGLDQVTDLSKVVLGLQAAMQGGMSQVYIRGVGDFSANPLANPGVAFNLDGVVIGRPESVNSNFYDIERMEVLKGPQGTLYGRNASGGAINVLTNNPSFDDDKSTLNVEVGNYALYHVDGAVNVPISSTFAVRLAFNKVSRDGYLSDGTDDDQEQGARLKALWKPSDDVSLLVNIDGEQVGGKGNGFVYLPQVPGANPWVAVSSPQSTAYLYSFPSDAGIVHPGTDSFIRDGFFNASAQLDWNLGFATLTVIPGYRYSNTDDRQYANQRNDLADIGKQETLETRLSHSDQTLKWVAGLYYFREINPGEIRVDSGPTLLYSKIPYDPSGTSYAAFGELTKSITDNFRLIAGARETTEKRLLSGIFYLTFDNGATFIDHENFSGAKTFNSFTWKLGSEYDLTAENMLFLTASTGFKAGGLTQTVAPDNVYQPEKVLAFELGTRNRYLDDRLQFNVESFYWSYKDQQESRVAFDPLGNFNFLTVNAGSSQIYGANVDLLTKPTRDDTFHLAAEYDHTKYTDFSYNTPTAVYNPAATGCRDSGTVTGGFLPLTILDCGGFSLPHAPLWTGLASFTHDFNLASGATVQFNASARYSDATWVAIEFTPQERAPAFTMVNTNLSYVSPSRRWTVAGYVHNINNAAEYTGGLQSSFGQPLFPANIGAPRTYGVQLHLQW